MRKVSQKALEDPNECSLVTDRSEFDRIEGLIVIGTRHHGRNLCRNP